MRYFYFGAGFFLFLNFFGSFDDNLQSQGSALARHTNATADIRATPNVKPIQLASIDTNIAAPKTPVSIGRKVNPLPLAKPTRLYVSGSTVNIRRGPSTNDPVIGSLKLGQSVHHTPASDTQNGKWIKIKTGRINGWMHGDYVQTTKVVITKRTQKAKKPKAKTKTRSIAPPTSPEITQARNDIIQTSKNRYLRTRGNCPCPENRKSNGHRCGGNSAWSRPGGESPRCYASDVTRSDLQNYFRRKGRVYR